MTDELTLKILAEIAEPGSGHLFSRREAARHAIAMIEQQAARIAELEADCAELEHDVKRHIFNHAADLAELAKDAEPIWCQSCGDGITAHDPGICGNCFAMKYRDASAEIFDRQRAGFDRCFEALGITDDRERDWSGLVIAIGDVVTDAKRWHKHIALLSRRHSADAISETIRVVDAEIAASEPKTTGE